MTTARSHVPRDALAAARASRLLGRRSARSARRHARGDRRAILVAARRPRRRGQPGADSKPDVQARPRCSMRLLRARAARTRRALRARNLCAPGAHHRPSRRRCAAPRSAWPAQHDGLGGRRASRARRSACRSCARCRARDALGDFLYGLFSCARALAGRVRCHRARGARRARWHRASKTFSSRCRRCARAFGWFPPRERGAIAAHVARLLGLDAGQQQRLLQLRDGSDALLDARRIEAQALAWAREIGLDT